MDNNTQTLKSNVGKVIPILKEHGLIDEAQATEATQTLLNTAPEDELDDDMVWSKLGKYINGLIVRNDGWFDSEVYQEFLSEKLGSTVEIENNSNDPKSLNINFNGVTTNFKIEDVEEVNFTKREFTDLGITIINAFLTKIGADSLFYPIYDNRDDFNVYLYAKTAIGVELQKEIQRIFNYPMQKISSKVKAKTAKKGAYYAQMEKYMENQVAWYNHDFPRELIEAEIAKQGNIDLEHDVSIILRASELCSFIASRYYIAKNFAKAKYYWKETIDIDRKQNLLIKKYYRTFYALREALINCYIGDKVAALESVQTNTIVSKHFNKITLANLYYFCGETEKAKQMYEEIRINAVESFGDEDKDKDNWLLKHYQSWHTRFEIALYTGDLKSAKEIVSQITKRNKPGIKSTQMLMILYGFFSSQTSKEDTINMLEALLKNQIREREDEERIYDINNYINIIKDSNNNSINPGKYFINGINFGSGPIT